MDQKICPERPEVQLTNGHTSEEYELGPYVIYDSGLVLFEKKFTECSWVNHNRSGLGSRRRGGKGRV